MHKVEDIIVAVLSSLAVLVNLLGGVSVVRSYKRLRQRMYVFVISLVASNVVLGLAFLSDVIMKFIYYRNQDAGNSEQDCHIKARDWLIVTESLKNSSIMLCSLNAIILTYALYMRTTRMGRHRADSYSVTAIGAESASALHLPAFDTMRRVLSLGPNAEKETEKGRSPTSWKSNNLRFDSSLRHDEDGLLPRPTNRRVSLTTQYIEKKKLNKFAVLMSKTKAKSRSASRFSRSSDGYVGRHGVSVVSYRVAVCLIVGVWVGVVALWITSTMLRFYVDHNREELSFLDLLTCPAECNGQFEQFIETKREMYPRENNGKMTEGENTLNRSRIKIEEAPSVNYSKCDACSTYFFPLTKLQTALAVAVIAITWLFMLISSLRLLWLRKHSNNVFVRCSALWRFILATAVFHLVGLSTYVILCVVDIIKNNLSRVEVLAEDPSYRAPESGYLYNMTSRTIFDRTINETIANKTSELHEYLIFNSQGNCVTHLKISLYISVSGSLVLFHSIVSPLLYLLRLLGCRRLFCTF